MVTDTATFTLQAPVRFGGEWIVAGDDRYEELRWLNPTRQSVKDTFGDNYERLLELKAKYDPDDVFRGTLSAP